MEKSETTNKTAAAAPGPAARGDAAIHAYLKTLPGKPGVYRMVNRAGDVLYVGKAKNLKKRVAAYTRSGGLTNRTLRMVSETETMEFITTHTEAEALLLEANLIKRYAPRYNILLRDDKSFPAILLTGDHPFPQVLKHRGARKRKGEYFGPFASVGAVNQTLSVLQRVFLLRTCTDGVFASRTRPCLLYQIKRCSAPCVGRIGETEYALLAVQARDFLRGHSRRIQQDLSARMVAHSDNLEYELAAQYRDRIEALTRIQSRQDINIEETADMDVMAAHQAGGQTCVQVFFFRGGRNFGNRAYFPNHARDDGAASVLEAFIGQFYANKQPPRNLVLGHRVENQALIREALSVHAGHRVQVTSPQRGEKRKAVDHALANAREALSRRMVESATQRRLLDGLAQALGLDAPPERIEVYDNSHISGAKAVGAMIVAGSEGMMKAAYRKFTIREALAAGDDYAMMREVLTRRFSRARKEDPDRARGQWPDLVMIDGGKGHLGVALGVFTELGVEDVALCAVAKGPDRNAGRERVYRPGHAALHLGARDPVLYFIQRLRDEAHRFAIGAHRGKRASAIQRSALDEIGGVGPQRKKALLHHFGSAKAVAQAGLEDLAAVDGISSGVAQKIYDWFHAER